jgi:hypothetical protein
MISTETSMTQMQLHAVNFVYVPRAFLGYRFAGSCVCTTCAMQQLATVILVEHSGST